MNAEQMVRMMEVLTRKGIGIDFFYDTPSNEIEVYLYNDYEGWEGKRYSNDLLSAAQLALDDLLASMDTADAATLRVELGLSDCIPAKHYGKLEKCKTCPDRHTCWGNAHGESIFDLNQEEE